MPETLSPAGCDRIVADETFILATRETGYRDVTSAVAELIDNSIQAGASRVSVCVREERDKGSRRIAIGVLDDGSGMSAQTLRKALQFGGTDRFDDRTGAGRFGMGLPNSSVSQARRFDVFSWFADQCCLHTYLDVEEVAAFKQKEIPEPAPRDLPAWAAAVASSSGTLVVWTDCDRLDRFRATTIAQRLRTQLSRMYRFALWRGIDIRVNGDRLTAFDPLFCDPRSKLSGGRPYGSPLAYEFKSHAGATSTVFVQFAELPVDEWHSWATADKRRAGVTGGAGVSFVRGEREIDYSWNLLGRKRRENYDDWWRCEVRFTPYLDELFGVTHSKQGVNPSAELQASVGTELEVIARTLNARVRAAFEAIDPRSPTSAERAATACDQFLPPRVRNGTQPWSVSYRIELKDIASPDFYRVRSENDMVVVTLNQQHPFFTHIYEPACRGSTGSERYRIECLLLAAARADLQVAKPHVAMSLSQWHQAWADALATYLDK